MFSKGKMKLLLGVVVALIGSAVADNQLWTKEMTEDFLSRLDRSSIPTVPQLIANAGYTPETHHVVTEDGYILEMHRISGSLRKPPSKKKPVVFLMHGLLSSSADWLIMGPGKGLGFILADAGYDVWMGNARGNTWSRNHTANLSNRRFWNFSWHEIGIYDLPAMIDYTLAATGEKQVAYVGHSQGTTSFFVMTSQKTEYNAKIKAMFALAPVAYMGFLRSPILRAASLGTTPLSNILNMVGHYEFMPSSNLGDSFCDDDAFSQLLCSNFLFILCGFNEAQLNTTMLPEIFQYTPAGAATKQLVHYGQEIRSRRFRMFDLGRVENRIRYGQWTPPNYDLGLITAPVHLIYSDNDWMAAVRDVIQLSNELGNLAELFRVRDPRWNHLDFVWGIDAKSYIYDEIIATLKHSYKH